MKTTLVVVFLVVAISAIAYSNPKNMGDTPTTAPQEPGIMESDDDDAFYEQEEEEEEAGMMNMLKEVQCMVMLYMHTLKSK